MNPDRILNILEDMYLQEMGYMSYNFFTHKEFEKRSIEQWCIYKLYQMLLNTMQPNADIFDYIDKLTSIKDEALEFSSYNKYGKELFLSLAEMSENLIDILNAMT